MNIGQIKAFLAVVDHVSFSEAARILGVSQPAVTMQVQALEADVDATLFDRGYRKVELTEAGRALLPYARRVIEELEQARESIEALATTVTGRLAIAASTTPGQYILPRYLGTFLARYPDVGVGLRVHDTTGVVAAVESGEADLGMSGAEVHGARVVHERLGADALVLIAPPGHPFATRDGVRFADLVDEPFIVREPGSGTRMVAEDTMRRSGIDPAEIRVVLELGTNEAVLSAVEGGMGLGVVSSLVAEKALTLGTVALVPEPSFPVSRPLYLVLPQRVPTRAAAALADHLRGVL